MKWYYKKTWCGMVLMVSYRVPDQWPGDWITKYRKATEKEAQEILTMTVGNNETI